MELGKLLEEHSASLNMPSPLEEAASAFVRSVEVRRCPRDAHPSLELTKLSIGMALRGGQGAPVLSRWPAFFEGRTP